MQTADTFNTAYANELPTLGAPPAGSRPWPSDTLVAAALELIWTQPAGGITVQDVAKRMSVTRRTLNRRFADALGHSVLSEIMKCRMHRAERLLTSTSLQIKQVAYLAGFTSAERMRVAFLDQNGVSPSQYRAQHAPANCGDLGG